MFLTRRDGDGLWDGYAYNTSAADWQLTQVLGAPCNMTGNLTSHCGEESTYSLFNGSFTAKTNRTSPDSDGDGLTDMFEVHGWPIRYAKVDLSVADNYTIANPNAKDTDGDGVLDRVLADVREEAVALHADPNEEPAKGVHREGALPWFAVEPVHDVDELFGVEQREEFGEESDGLAGSSAENAFNGLQEAVEVAGIPQD